jgi:hypothetical protein
MNWNYDEYTPEWVKGNMRTRYETIEVCVTDGISHPLDHTKSKLSVRPLQYYRHKDYPFWIPSREVSTGIFTILEDQATVNDFLEAIKTDHTREAYLFLCRGWDRTKDTDLYKKQREALLLISKNL